MLNLLKILQSVPELLLAKLIVIWNRKINIQKQFLCYTKSQNQSLHLCDATQNKTLITPVPLFVWQNFGICYWKFVEICSALKKKKIGTSITHCHFFLPLAYTGCAFCPELHFCYKTYLDISRREKIPQLTYRLQ